MNESIYLVDVETRPHVKCLVFFSGEQLWLCCCKLVGGLCWVKTAADSNYNSFKSLSWTPVFLAKFLDYFLKIRYYVCVLNQVLKEDTCPKITEEVTCVDDTQELARAQLAVFLNTFYKYMQTAHSFFFNSNHPFSIPLSSFRTMLNWSMSEQTPGQKKLTKT